MLRQSINSRDDSASQPKRLLRRRHEARLYRWRLKAPSEPQDIEGSVYVRVGIMSTRDTSEFTLGGSAPGIHRSARVTSDGRITGID